MFIALPSYFLLDLLRLSEVVQTSSTGKPQKKLRDPYRDMSPYIHKMPCRVFPGSNPFRPDPSRPARFPTPSDPTRLDPRVFELSPIPTRRPGHDPWKPWNIISVRILEAGYLGMIFCTYSTAEAPGACVRKIRPRVDEARKCCTLFSR